MEGRRKGPCRHRMWTEPRPTTHWTPAGGGGAAAAGWEPGLCEGERAPCGAPRRAPQSVEAAALLLHCLLVLLSPLALEAL